MNSFSILIVIVVIIAASSSTTEAFHLMRSSSFSRKNNKNLINQQKYYPCVCKNTSLCRPLTTPLPEKEFLMFQTNSTNWRTYDWRYVTSIALFGGYDPEMLCAAHERGVRVLMSTEGVPPNQLANATARSEFTTQAVQTVVENGWDGINLDFEFPLPADSAEEKLLTVMTQELQQRLKKANPHYSFSMDVAWSSNNIDGRNYEYDKLVEICDFVAIMDYDTRSQVFKGPPCFGGPNSPASTLFEGVASYLKLPSASSKKLVLGLPWYGYVYPCLNAESLSFEECQIPSVPFRGCPCSDAAGGQIIFSDIMQKARNSSFPHSAIITNTDMSKNETGSFATFNAIWPDPTYPGTKYRKFYFDNADTLREKYAAAKDLNLRGLAIWSVDMIYATSKESARDAKEMWDAFSAFV